MPKKTAQPRPRAPIKKERHTIQGNVIGDHIIIGDHNQVFPANKPVANLIPNLSEEENPLPSSLSLYLNNPMIIVGRLLNRHDALGILSLFLLAFLTYAGGIFLLRTTQGTPLPSSFSDFLFHIAPGERFYYPDWNALAFDFIFNPLVFAVTFYYPVLFLSLASYLFKVGVLKPDLKWDRRLASGLWIWALRLTPLFLGIMAIGISWFSRYRYYVNDTYLLRFYVLGLIGISTYLRNALIILLVHSVFLLVTSELKIIDILNLAAKSKYAKLGDLCLLIFYCCFLILFYAVTTLYTSMVKGVYLPVDYLSWEALIHLIIAILLLFGFSYRQLQIAGQIRRAKDEFASAKLTSHTDAESYPAIAAILKDTPGHPIIASVQDNGFAAAIVLMVDLLPIALYTIGISSR